MKKLFIALLFALPVVLMAQLDVRIKKSDFKKDEQGFKVAWKAIKQGNAYFRSGQGAYTLALENYWIALDYNEDNAALNYKIGVCYLYSGKNRVKAMEHLQKAVTLDLYVSPDVQLLLGKAYHLNLEFEKAVAEYNNYLALLSPRKQLKEKRKVDKLIQECVDGNVLVQKPMRVLFKNVGQGVNTRFDEYNSIFNKDENEMYFTSRRENSTKGRLVPMDKKFYEDVYLSKQSKEEWLEPIQLSKKINTKHNDAIVGISDNDNKLYFYNGDYKGGDILVSEFKKGKWGKANRISSKIRSRERETSMFLSADQKEFYFITNRKEGKGGKDIWVSVKDVKGKWQKPTPIDTLNSPYDEEGIAIDPSGKFMYFSSRGHNTMGGYDIFKAERSIDGVWGAPINMGYPVNTPDDDIFYKPTRNIKVAFMSSVRDDGFGGKDIYRLIYIGDEKEALLSAEDDYLAWTIKPIDDLFYRMPDKLIVDTSMFMVGTIADNSSNEGIQAKITLIDLDLAQPIGTYITSDTGKYKLRIPKKKIYGVEINAAGYLFFNGQVDLANDEFKNDIAIRDFKLDKLEVGAKMILKNIYFDLGKASLKPESYPELNRVVQFMKDNPSLKIEVSGHTDNQGSAAYNKKLSKDRAKSVTEYLTGNGIEEGRLKFEGYGFDQPVASNAKEEGRVQNRRVEFKILSVK